MNCLIIKPITYKGIMFTIMGTKTNQSEHLYLTIIHNNISIAIGYTTGDVFNTIPVYFLAEEKDIETIIGFCEDIRTIELEQYTLIVSYGGIINRINSKKYTNFNASIINETVASSSNLIVKSPAYSSLNDSFGLKMRHSK